MLTYYYIQTNIIGIIVLVILLSNKNIASEKTKTQGTYYGIVSLTAVELSLDSALWLLRGMTFTGAIALNVICTFAYYIIHYMIPLIWLIYTMEYFHIEGRLDALGKAGVLIPFITGVLCTILSLKTKWVFGVDEQNYVYGGKLSWLPSLTSFIYLIAAASIDLIMLKRMHTKTEKYQCISMASFMIIPITALFIQYNFYGTSLLWIGVALSLLMVFVNVQNHQISVDGLTGLNNRYKFDKYMTRICTEQSKSDKYSLLMIDIDKFKLINDNFGHTTGDRALVCVAEILKKACENFDAFAARYGGDEFAVVCSCGMSAQIAETIERETEQFNRKSSEPFTISLSIGETDFCGGGTEKVQDFVLRADQEMYAKKQSKKAAEAACRE